MLSLDCTAQECLLLPCAGLTVRHLLTYHVVYSCFVTVFQNYRLLNGQISGRTTTIPANLMTDIWVPSLGRFLDDYVDRFGYTTRFIYKLYKASERSMDRQDFIGRTSRYLSRQEAIWFYEFIEKFPGYFKAPTRRRLYVPVSV